MPRHTGSALLLPLAALALTGCGQPNPDSGSAVVFLPTVAAVNSAEPHLAKAPNGTVVMSWLEPAGDDMALRFSTLHNGEWASPTTVAAGSNWFVNWADFPSVVPVSDELWAAHWLVKRKGNAYAYDIAVSLSADAGAGWRKPITPHRDGTPTEHGFVSLFPARDGVGMLWLDGRNMAQDPANNEDIAATGMTLRSAVVTEAMELKDGRVADGLVCDCCQTDVTTNSGVPVAVYRDRSEAEIRDIYVTRFVEGSWSIGQPVATDGWQIAGCPVNGPAVASRGNNVAVAWFTAANDRPAVRFARSNNGALSFTKAIDVDAAKPIGRVDVAMLESGHSLVSWLQRNADGTTKLGLVAVSPDNVLGPVMTVAETAATRRSGFPQMVVSGDEAIVAWTDVSDERTQVRVARIAASALLVNFNP